MLRFREPSVHFAKLNSSTANSKIQSKFLCPFSKAAATPQVSQISWERAVDDFFANYFQI
jgi:hypothetical protein